MSTQWDSSWPKLAEEGERVFLTRYMEERFGIPVSVFHDWVFFKHQQSWWVVRNKSQAPLPRKLKVNMVGLKAFQKVGAFVKPTTRLIQLLGPDAKKSKLDITECELKRLLGKEALDYAASGFEDGYVILCLGCYVLGLGLLIRGKLRSQIPKKYLTFYDLDG
jgi:NOL1/NOP2/fmu family ribosome biogenesis protein